LLKAHYSKRTNLLFANDLIVGWPCTYETKPGIAKTHDSVFYNTGIVFLEDFASWRQWLGKAGAMGRL